MFRLKFFLLFNPLLNDQLMCFILGSHQVPLRLPVQPAVPKIPVESVAPKCLRERWPLHLHPPSPSGWPSVRGASLWEMEPNPECADHPPQRGEPPQRAQHFQVSWEGDMMTGHDCYWHPSLYLMFNGKLSFGSYFIWSCPIAALPTWTPVWCTEDSRRAKARTKNTKISSGKQSIEPRKKMYTSNEYTFYLSGNKWPLPMLRLPRTKWSFL